MRALLARLFGPYGQLAPGIWALFAAILINRMGNFVAPFLTLYLTQKAGFTAEQTGFFVMLLPLAVIPALLAGGWMVDHWGRRRVLVAAQALAGGAYLVASFDPVGPGVPFWMVAATFLAGVGGVAHNAMLNDLTVPENRKTAFSLNYLGINLGFSLGPMAAGFLFTADLRLFFIVDGISSWISAALVWFLTRETLHAPAAAQAEGAPGEQNAEGGLWKALAQRPYFLIFLGVGLLSQAVYGQHTFSLPLQLDHDFGNQGASVFGTLMAVNGLTVVLGSTILTRLTARFASLPVVAAASLLYAVGFGMIGITSFLPGSPLFWLVVSTVIWSVGEILASVAGHVYQASHTPANHRGRFNSVRSVAWNLASSLSTALVGLYIGGWGVTAVWPAVAAVSVLSGLCLLLVHRREHFLDGSEERSLESRHRGAEMEEKRRAPRCAMDDEVYLGYPGSDPYPARVMDVSAHGIRVRFDEELERGTPVTISLEFLKEDLPNHTLQVEGEVMHRFREPEGTFQIGLKLRFQDEVQAKSLMSHLASCRSTF